MSLEEHTRSEVPAQQALDYNLQRKALNIMHEVSDQVRSYLCSAIQYANTANGLSDQAFWDGLIRPQGRMDGTTKQWKPTAHTIIERKQYERGYNGNPYRSLDLQAIIKYLYFGRKRQRDSQHVDDSQFFFKMFVPASFKDQYYGALSDAIRFRNNYLGHISDEVYSSLTTKSLYDFLSVFHTLVACLDRDLAWCQPPLRPVDLYWQEMMQQVNALYGAAPINLTELGCELFATLEMTQTQSTALQQALGALQIPYRDTNIYAAIPRDALLKQLSEVAQVAQLLGTSGTTSEQPARKKSAGDWRAEAQTTAAATKLCSAGHLLALSGDVLGSLLDCFILLVDETIFFSVEGRRLLLQLQPVLAARHQRLFLDASVPAAIFSAFRSSVPLTPLERSKYSPDELEEIETTRSQLHDVAKDAIKSMRYLQERQCLRIMRSTKNCDYSYESLLHLAQSHEHRAFLVLTMERQIASIFAPVPNVAAAKVGLDDQIMIYSATRAHYQQLIASMTTNTTVEWKEDTTSRFKTAATVAPAAASAPVGEPVAADRYESHQQFALAPVAQTTPETGEILYADYGDGKKQQIHLGAFIASGGEGSIYRTALPDTAAKLYSLRHLTKERQQKLMHMVAVQPNLPGLCWPQAMLYNQRQQWVGFLMPLADGYELATTIFTPGRGNRNLTELGWDRLHVTRIAENIAKLFAQMHEHSILMGDINPRNFMVTRDCRVYFVDCDSYQFGQFTCPVFSPLFLPPELHTQLRNSTSGSEILMRTEYTERYSLAVLLFQTLMLGKAPYESRNSNNEDIVDAILSGTFPYPFKSNREDGEERRTSSNILAPVGVWRNIWSHMTHLVKERFYECFTGGTRCSAADWVNTLRAYREILEKGNGSRELSPTTYKDVSEMGVEGATPMVDLQCSDCGKHFNMDQAAYEQMNANSNNKKKRIEILCPTCRNQQRMFRSRPKELRCDHCGNLYTDTVYNWLKNTESGLPFYCPSCRKVDVTCTYCGKVEQISRIYAMQRQNDYLCNACRQFLFVKVRCENCGAEYTDSRQKIEYLQQTGQACYCRKCRNA